MTDDTPPWFIKTTHTAPKPMSIHAFKMALLRKRLAVSASDEDATRPLLRRGGAGAAATEPDATLLEVEEHDARAREPSHGIDRKSDRGGDGALAANSSAAGPHAAAYARGFEAGLRKAAQQRDWAAMERDSDSQRGW